MPNLKDLKRYVKHWSITDIINQAGSYGMETVARPTMTEAEYKAQQRVLINEINRRLREK